jgi:asparagine synthase (glutamine-hydrolysing)
MIAGVRGCLLEAVHLHLRVNVPVGIYLSGGIDSSAVTGMVTHLVKEQGTKARSQDIKKKVCSFTIAFDENSGYDESGM